MKLVNKNKTSVFDAPALIVLDLMQYFPHTYVSLGYHGLYCEEEYDECRSDPCQNHATCRDLINAYECVCQPQYEGM